MKRLKKGRCCPGILNAEKDKKGILYLNTKKWAGAKL
jgi:hypothetical protein